MVCEPEHNVHPISGYSTCLIDENLTFVCDHPAQTEYHVTAVVQSTRESVLRANCNAVLQFTIQRCFSRDVAQSLSYRAELDERFWKLLSQESGELDFPPLISEASITFEISPLRFGELPMPCLDLKKIEKSNYSQDSKMLKPVLAYSATKAEFVHVS